MREGERKGEERQKLVGKDNREIGKKKMVGKGEKKRRKRKKEEEEEEEEEEKEEEKEREGGFVELAFSI